MAFTSVHPHKGYLNSEFRIHTNQSQPLSYKVYSDKNKPVVEGVVYPNEPHSIKIPLPGEYVVEFNDGSSVNLVVEDGYKFGGGSYKASFVHDTCPWVFIVMHDRTYFYNRITEESYVELISPDLITFVSDRYVLFSNTRDDVKTLYSLNEQRPILCIKDIIYYDSNYVIWHVGDYHLVLFSLDKQEADIEVICDSYVVKSDTKQIFHTYNNKLCRIDIEGGCTSTFLSEIKGTFIKFVGAELCVSYEERTNSNLHILNMSTCEVSSLKCEGVLSSVNGTNLVDILKERQSIYQFNLKESGFPNAIIEGKYVEINLYPALWDVFYTIKTTSIYKSLDHYNVSEETYLKSLNSKVEHKLESNNGEVVVNEYRFCFYNSSESYVCGRVHSGSGYLKGGQIYVHKDVVHLKSDKSTYTLSRNGYWDGKREVNYDYEYFAKFGVIRDKDTGVFKSLSGKEYEGNRVIYNYKHDYIVIDDMIFYANGKTLSTKYSDIHFSDDRKYGVKVTRNSNGNLSGDIILCTLNNGYFEEREILQSLFDSSAYKNVLFSDNGEQVMYQSEGDAVVMNIATGQSEKFSNMSYIKHVNGIRLFFETASSLQPRLVNPITKQYVNCNMMPDFQFVSPDGKLYADTRLRDYIEYYFKESGTIITKDEYDGLLNRFSYPYGVAKDHDSYVRVAEDRKQFIRDNFEFLKVAYPHDFKNTPNCNNWSNYILEESSITFVQRVIGLRGVAVIRYTETDAEVTRISLGKPLSYINYVSFSYDSRYVALGGYRDSTHGLFLVYDLRTMEIVYHDQRPRAVWTTAFSSQGAVASYSGEPITFFAYCPDEYCRCEQLNKRNFLTFSPDGNYLALSDQGYVSKYDRNGNERASWGHQPSTKVIVTAVNNVKNELYEFNDLADGGISDSPKSSNPTSVASVSFSCDNSKLMMVGEDGVIVIRNLPYKDNDKISPIEYI